VSRNDLIAEVTPEITALRHDIHAHPELGFQERRTADLIAARLNAAGIVVHRGLTETAVIGVLKNGSSSRRVIFRAELDALPILEKSGVPFASKTESAMHACGHDGHMSMLVGAAELLAHTRGFDGTIIFVFQPAEEVHGGAKTIIDAGLLKKFPADAAYSVHNWPGVPEGQLVIGPGPRMAAVDDFTITFNGTGCHAAMPNLGDDPILAATEFVNSAQRIVSRTVDPQTALVLSFTQIHGGTINNVVPPSVRVEGTCRFFRKDYSDHAERQLRRIAEGICTAHGLKFDLDYRRGYPSVINSAEGAATARRAALQFAATEQVPEDVPASMGCEDFAYLLNAVGNGCYVWLGAGDVGPGAGLHGDRYVFNDKLIPIGLRFWTELAAAALPIGAA
jgi:hippurate hydrolase